MDIVDGYIDNRIQNKANSINIQIENLFKCAWSGKELSKASLTAVLEHFGDNFDGTQLESQLSICENIYSETLTEEVLMTDIIQTLGEAWQYYFIEINHCTVVGK